MAVGVVGFAQVLREVVHAPQVVLLILGKPGEEVDVVVGIGQNHGQGIEVRHKGDGVGNQLFPPFFEGLVDEPGGGVPRLILLEYRFPRPFGQVLLVVLAVERAQGVVVAVAGVHGEIGLRGVAPHLGHEGRHAGHGAGYGSRLGDEVHTAVLRGKCRAEAVVHAAGHITVLLGPEGSEVAPAVIHALVYRVDLTFQQFALRGEHAERVGPVQGFIKVGHQCFRVVCAGTVPGYVVDMEGDEPFGSRRVGGVVAVVGGTRTAEELRVAMQEIAGRGLPVCE